MKSIEFDSKVLKKLKLFQKRDPKFYKKIIKQLDLFEKNPQHESLRLHKLKRGKVNVWSISLDKSFRMLYTENSVIYFFDIGTHDQVYRDS